MVDGSEVLRRNRLSVSGVVKHGEAMTLGDAVLLLCALAAFVLAAAWTQQAHSKPRRDDLARCMVYVPDIADAKLRRWCLQQSKRLP